MIITGKSSSEALIFASTTLISLLTVEVGINVEGVQSCNINECGGWGFLEKKLVHNCNKRGVEGGKDLKINKRGGWDFLEKTST